MRVPEPFLPIIMPAEYSKMYASECCLLTRNPLSGSWDEMDWSTFGRFVDRVSNAMIHLGVNRGDRGGYLSEK